MNTRISLVFECEQYELIVVGSIICGTRLIVTMGACLDFSIDFDFFGRFDVDRLARRRRPLLLLRLLDRDLPLLLRLDLLELLFY